MHTYSVCIICNYVCRYRLHLHMSSCIHFAYLQHEPWRGDHIDAVMSIFFMSLHGSMCLINGKLTKRCGKPLLSQEICRNMGDLRWFSTSMLVSPRLKEYFRFSPLAAYKPQPEKPRCHWLKGWRYSHPPPRLCGKDPETLKNPLGEVSTLNAFIEITTRSQGQSQVSSIIGVTLVVFQSCPPDSGDRDDSGDQQPQKSNRPRSKTVGKWGPLVIPASYESFESWYSVDEPECVCSLFFLLMGSIVGKCPIEPSKPNHHPVVREVSNATSIDEIGTPI